MTKLPSSDKITQFDGTLVFIDLYWRKADFLIKAHFLQICILKGIGQFYRKDVNIININNK
jgi:hypothetical protein